ncbi:histidine kinase [Glycomyces halotolerans]
MSQRQPSPFRGRRMDLAIAGVTLALSLLSGLFKTLDGASMPLYAWPLLAAGPLALLAWRGYPRAVMLVAVAALVGTAHVGLGPGVAVASLFAIAFSMYSGHRRLTIGLVLVVSAFTAVGNLQAAGWQLTADAIEPTMLVVGWLHVAMMGGEGRRQRDAYMEEAERTKQQELRRKAADERVRIARELHDSLTHSISVIRVQAGVAVHLARKRGEQPLEALLAVDEAAKDATRELQETLTMLRGDEGPRLGRVGDLLDRYQGLGFEIDLNCPECGSLDLDPEVDHAAYRIVQEALTNAVRHSDGDRIEVAITRDADALDIAVADNGSPGPAEPGRGLIGMRERVDSLGGSLTVGPDLHGFTVRARLPVRAASETLERTAP